MRSLPVAMTRGPWFTQVLREARQDPHRSSLYNCCGARMIVELDKAEQTVRCQACARWQTVAVVEEIPWRLTPASAEALRHTKTWLRRL